MKTPKKRPVPKSRSTIAASLADRRFLNRIEKPKKAYDRKKLKGQDDGDNV